MTAPVNRWTDALRVSPQQTDPLSWITRPWVSLSFATIAAGYGLAVTLFTWHNARMPWLDVAAVFAIAASCLYVQVATRPLKPKFSPGRAMLPLTLAMAALVLSTGAAASSQTPVTEWWAPIGVGLLIATCGPYSTAPHLVAYGLVFSVATGVAAWLAFVGRDDPWTGLSTIIIACSSVVVATVATSVFSYTVVVNTQLRLGRVGIPVADDEAVRDAAARRAEVTTLARLGSRVAPFLASVADANEVTAGHRALAGQLARRLRSDLVTQANRSWLDSLALRGRIFVVDPDNRADSMNAAQRAALRGLVLAVIDDPSTVSGSLFIELRAHDDGSTAVALSIDMDLPEGRRVTMIAPYYVALKTTVNDISWDPVRDLLSFRLPPKK